MFYPVLYEDIEKKLRNAYINLFVFALDRNMSLYEAVDKVSKRTDAFIENGKENESIVRGMDGIYFVTALAKYLGTSIHELMNISKNETREMIYHIIREKFADPFNFEFPNVEDIDYDKEKECGQFSIRVSVDTPDDTVGFYTVRFYKDYTRCYSMIVRMVSGEIWENGLETDLMFESAAVWSEEKGELADYIETFIDRNIRKVLDIETNEDDEEPYRGDDELAEMNSDMMGMDNPEIGVQDYLIRTSLFQCINQNHHLTDVRAAVYIDTGTKIIQYKTYTYYCPECDEYYITEAEFKKLKSIGRICCKLITVEEYRKICSYGYDAWAQKSLLNSLGYNVNASDNYTALQRQRILSYVIENKLMKLSEVINFISWLLERPGGRNMESAKNKYRKDLEYLHHYIPDKNVVVVGSFTQKRYKRSK